METKSYFKIEKVGYQVIVFAKDDNSIDPNDDNVDVQVNFDDGRRLSATFFTLKNIQSLLERYRFTGECSEGRYFYCVNSVIAENLAVTTIELVIADLISSGELESAFSLDSDAE